MSYRSRRRIRFIFVLVMLYALMGFLVLPPLVKSELERELTAELGRLVQIGNVQLNPFTLSATIELVKVRKLDGRGTLGGWDRLYVNFDAIRSLAGEWVFSDIELDGFHTELELQPDGSFNLSDLIKKYSRRWVGPASPGWYDRPVRIHRLRIARARIEFADHSRPGAFHTVVDPIDFTLLGFHTAGPRGAAYRFEAATTAGEKFSWNGTITAAPFASTGEWRMENLPLANYASYFGSRHSARIAGGVLSVSGRYEINLAPQHRHVLVRDGTAAIKGLRVLGRSGDDPVIELDFARATGIAADSLAPRVTIGALHLDGGHLAVRREVDGTSNLMDLFQSTGATPSAPAAAKPLDLTVREITWRDFDVTLRDLAAAQPVQLQLTRANGTLKDFSLAAGAVIPVDMAFAIAPQGTIHAAGVFMVEPLQADVDLAVAKLPLAPFNAYVEPTVHLRLQQGVGAVKGHVKLAATGGGPFNVEFTGAGRVENLALANNASAADRAGFSQFAFNDVRLAIAPRLALSIKDAKLDGPYAHVALTPGGKLNLADARPSAAANADPATPTPATTGPGGATPDIAVTRATITGGEFQFVDETTSPPVHLSLEQTNAQLRNFSSQRPDQGKLELHALVNGTSTLEAHGRLGQTGRTVLADVTVDGAPADLQPAAPYIAKYAGFEFKGGRVTLESQANVSGAKLDMHNTVTLEDFSLGRPTDSPDAVKLPVRLGVALLKDASGRIVLDIPVQASMADPNFHFGEVVGQAFTNVLKETATSPFTLLGSMFGGGGEELARQDFAPGGMQLTEESMKRLATVQRALANRPALRLEIEGGYDPVADEPALKRAKLDELVRQRFWGERHAAQPNLPPPGKLELSDADRAAAMRAMFAEEFPRDPDLAESAPEPAAAESAQVTEAPATSKPEPAQSPAQVEAQPALKKHRGLFGRAWDTVTLKPVRRKIGRTIARVTGHDKPKPAPVTPPPSKPAPQVAAAPELPPAEIERRLIASVRVSPDDLRRLAEARARHVRDQLVGQGKIAPQRVKIAKAVANKGARVTLQLR